jgi:hypothetical protein
MQAPNAALDDNASTNAVREETARISDQVESQLARALRSAIQLARLQCALTQR